MKGWYKKAALWAVPPPTGRAFLAKEICNSIVVIFPKARQNYHTMEVSITMHIQRIHKKVLQKIFITFTIIVALSGAGFAFAGCGLAAPLTVYHSNECTCIAGCHSDFQVVVILDIHDHKYLPFLKSQDTLPIYIIAHNPQADTNYILERHRENALQFYSNINRTFFEELGFALYSYNHRVTISYFTPFNAITFYSAAAFNDFYANAARLRRSRVASAVNIIRLCNASNQFR